MRLIASFVLSARAARVAWSSAFGRTNDPRWLIKEGQV